MNQSYSNEEGLQSDGWNKEVINKKVDATSEMKIECDLKICRGLSRIRMLERNSNSLVISE